MLKDKFVELEKRIKAAAEYINTLKEEKVALEEKCNEAQKEVAELNDQIDFYQSEQEDFSSKVEDLIEQFDELPSGEVSGLRGDGLPLVGNLEDDQAHEEQLELEVDENLDDYGIQYQLGKTNEKNGEWEAAIEAYRRAIRTKPDFIEAIEHLAFLLEKLNREKEASPLWERVISLKK